MTSTTHSFIKVRELISCLRGQQLTQCHTKCTTSTLLAMRKRIPVLPAVEHQVDPCSIQGWETRDTTLEEARTKKSGSKNISSISHPVPTVYLPETKMKSAFAALAFLWLMPLEEAFQASHGVLSSGRIHLQTRNEKQFEIKRIR